MPDRDDVSRYYDENTGPFLARGQGGGEGVLHRAVWGEGVGTRAEAFHHVHELLLRELELLGRASPRILDLGCGVGTSLLYLLGRIEGEGFGITNSDAQLKMAVARSREDATFQKGDFCADPLPPGIDLAYGIESFVHARDPARFSRTRRARSGAAGGSSSSTTSSRRRHRASPPSASSLPAGTPAPSSIPREWTRSRPSHASSS